MKDEALIKIQNAEDRIFSLLKLPPLTLLGVINGQLNLRNAAKKQ